MKSFKKMSLSGKILLVGAVTMILLNVTLFVLYAYDAKKKTLDAYVEKARAISLTAESTREEMEAKWDMGLFTSDDLKMYAENGELDKVVSSVPVVSAWNAAMRKSERGGYVFRVAKFSPRRPENQPDYGLDYQVEGPAIMKIKAENLSEYYMVDEKINSIRYFLPVRLTETCMLCHGDPATSQELWGNDKGLDPTGVPMENWTLGSIHGVFEVIQSLDKADSLLKHNLVFAGFFAAGLILVSFGVFFMVVRTQVVMPIKAVIDGLNEGAHEVAQASGQLSSSGQSLAAGASQQASYIDKTSSSLEEMSSVTKQNADNAVQADNLMKAANRVVEHASESMEELTLSMEEISKASEETSKIVKTIDEIAFQTNLLALNAAVEAARAGEAGAGFAVVADEVRNLALRAADAAKNTAGLIEDTVKKTESGNELVSTANKAFTEVKNSSSKVGVLVSEIAEASNEQAVGIEEVKNAIIEMDNVTQKNAATAEETASSSEELNAQAETMADYVSQLSRIVNGRAGQSRGQFRGREIKSNQVTPMDSSDIDF